LNPQFGSNTDLQFINIIESNQITTDDITNQEEVVFTPSLQNNLVNGEKHHY